MPSSFRTGPTAAAIVLAFAALLGVWAIGDPRILRLLANTAMLSVASCLIAIPAGTFLAVLFFRTDLPGRRFLGLSVVVMLFIPLYLQAAAWDAGFGRQGWFVAGQDAWGGWQASIWIHGLVGVPWVVLIVGVALRLVEGEYEELALLEAPLGVVLVRVTLRRGAAAIAVAAVWVGVATAGEMTVTDLYQVRTLAEEIYIALPLGEWTSTGTQWRSLALVIAALTMLAFAAASRLAPTAVATPVGGGATFPLGWRKHPLSLLVWGMLLVLVVVPVTNLCLNAGVVVRSLDGEIVRGWRLTALLWNVGSAPARFAEEFGWSLMIGGLAALAAVSVGIPLAWSARRHSWLAGLALGVTAICLATPGPVIGLITIWLLNRDSDFLLWLYNDTIFAPCLAMFTRGLPLALLVSWHALRSIPPDQLEAAATEGVGPRGRLWRVAAPQRIGALTAAWLAALAVSMGDLAATILVTPPGVSTVATRVFGLLHAGVDDHAAGLCLAIAGLFLGLGLLTIACWRFLGQRFRSAAGG